MNGGIINSITRLHLVGYFYFEAPSAVVMHCICYNELLYNSLDFLPSFLVTLFIIMQ